MKFIQGWAFHLLSLFHWLSPCLSRITVCSKPFVQLSPGPSPIWSLILLNICWDPLDFTSSAALTLCRLDEEVWSRLPASWDSQLSWHTPQPPCLTPHLSDESQKESLLSNNMFCLKIKVSLCIQSDLKMSCCVPFLRYALVVYLDVYAAE